MFGWWFIQFMSIPRTHNQPNAVDYRSRYDWQSGAHKVFPIRKSSAVWSDDLVFQKTVVTSLKVVNGVVEHSIGLVQAYSGRLTEDKRVQLLLRLVAAHRKQFPVPIKTARMKPDFTSQWSTFGKCLFELDVSVCVLWFLRSCDSYQYSSFSLIPVEIFS